MTSVQLPKKFTWFLSLITAAPGVAAVIIVAAWVYAELRIAPLFSGYWVGNYTTHIYSAPFRLRRGKAMEPRELRGRLERLDYKASGSPPLKAGEYRERDGRFEIYLRGFSDPVASQQPVLAEASVDHARLRTLACPPPKPCKQAWLEPELLYELSGPQMLRREPLRYDQIPETIKLAVIAVEDRRFYQHPGVDLRGILRAAVRNFHLRRAAQGGSTLTQQLARNLFLTSRKTLPRKFTEMLIAFYMESRLPKDQIMRMYLDTVYLGQKGPVSVIGLVAAARHFFNKTPLDLTLEDCALLAGMVQSPRMYNPFDNPRAALRRRNIVLAAMRSAGFINGAREEAARAKGLGVTAAGQYDPLEADHFVAYVQRSWEKRYDENSLSRGLSIYTTLDPWLQANAQRAVQKTRHEAALVALDPASGAIRALVGGKDFGASPFDRASQALRQPGSTFKPFVYGAALETGDWTADSILSDRAGRYPAADGVWEPTNYDGWFRGDVPLRKALAQSLNGATVRLARAVGPDKVIAYARKLGILAPLKNDLGVALGVYEVTLLELTGAYCAFANGGLRADPYGVEAAVDRNQEIVERHRRKDERVLSRQQAAAMTGLLREVVVSGTAKDMKRWNLDSLAAGKTGTTDEGKDAWFIGYTSSIVAGVWVGSDMPTKLDLSGAGAALPIWAEFVSSAFPVPVVKSTAAAVAVSSQPVVEPQPGPQWPIEPPPEPEKSGFFGWVHRLFHRD